MKRLAIVCLCFLLVFSLVSCSDTQISGGVINGSTYTNSCVGVTFQKPDGWKFLSAEEIATLVGSGQTAQDLSNIQEYLVNKATIYDMVAQNETNGNSVSVMYENTTLTAFRELTAKEYAEMVSKTLEQSQYTCSATGNATLSGTEFVKFMATTQSNGISVSQAYYFRADGKYVYTVILTSATSSAEDFESLF